MRLVLFVDDEPAILAGLTRQMHPDRDGWQVLTATSGQEALTLMATHDVNVVVTDRRMPDMDGDALLHVVAERFPQVRRIMLTGTSRDRAAGDAHVVLSKPCTKTQLIQALEDRSSP